MHSQLTLPAGFPLFSASPMILTEVAADPTLNDLLPLRCRIDKTKHLCLETDY